MFWNFWERFESAYSKVVRSVSTVLLALIFIMFILNVVVRFVPVYNFTETDDWIQIFLIWMIFLGAAELVRTRNHFVVDFAASHAKSLVARRTLRVLIFLVECSTYAIVFYYGIVWVIRSNSFMQSIPWFQVRWMYIALPFNAFFMALFSVVQIIKDFKTIDGETNIVAEHQ